MTGNSVRFNKYLVHALWAALPLGVTLFMLATIDRGHPPLIAFLPLVVLLWVAGHLVIWGVLRLAAWGRRGPATDRSAGRSWPLGLLPALFGSGVLTAGGLLQLLASAYLGRWYPYRHVELWLFMLAVQLLHAACCVGLLLRKRWSRQLSVLLTGGWALLLAAQLGEHLPPARTASGLELLLVAGLLLALLGLGLYLARSRQVKAFLQQ